MSWKMVECALKVKRVVDEEGAEPRKITFGEKAILVYLSHRVWEDGQKLFVSMGRTAGDMSCSRYMAQKTVRVLIASHLLTEVETRKGRSSLYCMHPAKSRTLGESTVWFWEGFDHGEDGAEPEPEAQRRNGRAGHETAV